MTAREVKDALRLRHPATDPLGGPGQWTTVEEWHSIDLLAFNAWASQGPRYGRVGYEVKVSRGDYRRELLRPGKRAGAVAFCHEFYFAVPKGLLKPEEVEFSPPAEFAEWSAYVRERCPGYFGARCIPGGRKRSAVAHVRFGIRRRYGWANGYDVVCPTCSGKGFILPSLVERFAPTLWVPADVGLVEVSEGGCRVAKKAPRREAKELQPSDISGLVRHVSFRPDPRHRERAA